MENMDYKKICQKCSKDIDFSKIYWYDYISYFKKWGRMYGHNQAV
jgi:hypothetical protein